MRVAQQCECIQCYWTVQLSMVKIVCFILCDCVHAQSCPTLCISMDCSLPGSSVHGILQARILEWVDMLSPPGNLPDPGIKPTYPCVSCTAGRFFSCWVMEEDFYHNKKTKQNSFLKKRKKLAKMITLRCLFLRNGFLKQLSMISDPSTELQRQEGSVDWGTKFHVHNFKRFFIFRLFTLSSLLLLSSVYLYCPQTDSPSPLSLSSPHMIQNGLQLQLT